MSRIADKRKSMGLSALSGQVYRKASKRGFDFTLMVVGESGLGKSTFINSLFLQEENLSSNEQRKTAAQRIERTVEVVPNTVVLTEKGVQLKLTIVDTPGFGDSVNNDKCWQPVVDYIDTAYHVYLRDESKVDRSTRQDDRVHACVYFISPTGHGMKPLDIETIKALHHKVNVIPVIAKADTLTKSELKAFKASIIEDIEKHELNVFRPIMDEEDDDETHNLNLNITSSIPFAVVGSNSIVDVGGRSIRGRSYPWGVVEVDNEAHCDFQLLRTMLVRTHMQDLKDCTLEYLYENFRKAALANDPEFEKLRERTKTLDVATPARAADEAEIEKKQKELADQARMLEEQRKQLEEQRLMYEKLLAQQAQQNAQLQQGGSPVRRASSTQEV